MAYLSAQMLTRSTVASQLVVADGEPIVDRCAWLARPARRHPLPSFTEGVMLTMQRSSQHVAAISSPSSSFGAPYPTLRLSTPSLSSAATRPRRQTCRSETATCGAVSPFPSTCTATTGLVPSHLTRRAAVLIDVLALPVRAPGTTSG